MGITRSVSLKDLCRQTADNEHFKDYIYSIKSLRTFERELNLLLDFTTLNHTGFRKILKKQDKVMGTTTQEQVRMENLGRYWEGGSLQQRRRRKATSSIYTLTQPFFAVPFARRAEAR